MQRFNLFIHSHKGLKALLYDTGMSLLHTDFWNVEDSGRIILRMREIISLFGKHAYGEDCFVLAAVKKYEPSVGDAFEQDHAYGRELAEELSAILTAYEAAAVITDKVWVAEKINMAYNRFLVFHIEVMEKEEEVLMPILWRYYNDQELLNMKKQVLSKLPAPLHVKMNNWMLKGMNIGEIVGWLKNVERSNGEFIYEALLNSAEIALSWQRFDMVIKGLDEQIAAA
ncbi:hypothetical protein LZZ85_21445 [Terrimonas sp. NA20]|uniref:Hemerythrin-like domain-containing protein n=1 Tax=Terrimonas ginsenosidimutans TaxID=2908004 RepID=A0ABS9KX35_9BACT|nr:hypothetical protein [Terrimonas ginsenosidimutans]MCG2616876.1 hypothetical protein [Terrimonas ginsenosidimutans]